MAKIITKTLPCRLTEKEISVRTRDMVTLMKRIAEQKDSEKDRRKAWKKDADGEAKRVEDFRAQISDGVELREVRCEERRNEQQKTMDVIRTDARDAWLDGAEIVNSRPLTPNELQIELLSDHRRERDASIPADEKFDPNTGEVVAGDDEGGDEGDEDEGEDEDKPSDTDAAFDGIEPVDMAAPKTGRKRSPKKRAAAGE